MKKYITSLQAGQLLDSVTPNNTVAKLKSFLEDENELTVNELLMDALTGSEYVLMDKVNKTTKVGKEYVAQFMEKNKDKIILQNDPVINNILSTENLFDFIPISRVEFVRLPEYQLFDDIYIKDESIVVINEYQDDGSIKKIVTNIYLTSNPLNNSKSNDDLSSIKFSSILQNVINCVRLKQLNSEFDKIDILVIRISKSYPFNNQLINISHHHDIVIKQIKMISDIIKHNYELINDPLQKISFNIKDQTMIKIKWDGMLNHLFNIDMVGSEYNVTHK